MFMLSGGAGYVTIASSNLEVPSERWLIFLDDILARSLSKIFRAG